MLLRELRTILLTLNAINFRKGGKETYEIMLIIIKKVA